MFLVVFTRFLPLTVFPDETVCVDLPVLLQAQPGALHVTMLLRFNDSKEGFGIAWMTIWS